jgi:hypothetical protein
MTCGTPARVPAPGSGRHARKQSVPSPSAARGTPGLAHPPVGRAAGSHAGLATLRRVRDTGACREVLPIVSDRSDAVPGARPAQLILVEQSGAKRQIPQPSAVSGMIEAEQVMHRHGLHRREIKVVSQHQAIARWKPGELGWHRVA